MITVLLPRRLLIFAAPTFLEDFSLIKAPTPKPDLSKHEDEAVSFDEVMKKSVKAKPNPKKPEPSERPEK